MHVQTIGTPAIKVKVKYKCTIRSVSSKSIVNIYLNLADPFIGFYF